MLKPTWLLEEEKKLTKKIIYLKFCIPYHYIYINIRVWNVQRWLYSDSTVIIGNFMDLFRVYSKIYSKEWLKEFWICSSFYLPSSSRFLLSENRISWKFKKKNCCFWLFPVFSIGTYTILDLLTLFSSDLIGCCVISNHISRDKK